MFFFFNGFRGDLYIRSGDTLYSVREEVSQRTPFLSGVNIFFYTLLLGYEKIFLKSFGIYLNGRKKGISIPNS